MRLRPTAGDEPSNRAATSPGRTSALGHCPVCGADTEFGPAGLRRRPRAMCTRCGSLERHRALVLALRSGRIPATDPLRVLHVAPEAAITRWLTALPGADYLSIDLRSPAAMRHMDLTALDLPDEAFDLIVCSHVLEHIPDDRRAMRELHRVLAPGGLLSVQVPIERGMPRTDEDPAVTDPSERERRWGQSDHVRLYGLDLADRLATAGFDVEAVPTEAIAGAEDIDRMALPADDVVHLCRRVPVPAAAVETSAGPGPATVGPTVTIAVAITPDARFLGDAVASALAQEQPADEIVLVDGGPPGGPGSIVADAAIDGVRYVRASGAAAELWNRAVAESTGDIVILLDPDDLLGALAVGSHLEVLRGSEAGVAAGDVIVVDDTLTAADEAFWGPASVVEHLAAGDWLPSGAMAIRRSSFATVGEFRTDVGGAWFAEWLARAVQVVSVIATGGHTLARRGVGFDDAEVRGELTVLHTVLTGCGPAAVTGHDDPDDPAALIEVGLRLLRLGDAATALRCFEEAEATTPTPAGGELVVTVRAALDSGELETVEPHPLSPVSASQPPIGSTDTEIDGPATSSTIAPIDLVDLVDPGVALGRSAGPSITIAVPTFDRETFLADAIDSALAQTRPADEIIVVDDGSTDGTAELVARYASRGVRYVRQPRSGAPVARNRCIVEATGEYLVWLDSDDVLVPTTLETHLARLAEVPDAAVVYGDLQLVDDQLRPGARHHYDDWYGDGSGLIARLFRGNCIPNPSTLIRRSVLVEAGGYRPDFPRAHDYELFSRLAETHRFAHHRDVVLGYRIHDGEVLSGLLDGKDLRYEVTIVHRLLERHALRTLLPQIEWQGDPVEAEATAHTTVAVRLAELGDLAGAVERARRAHELMPSAAGGELVRTLDDAVRSGLGGCAPFAISELQPLVPA